MKPSSLPFRALELYGTRLHHRGQWRVHPILRKVFHADVNCELEVERAGLRWALNPSDYVHSDLFWFGEYDRWLFWHAKRMVKPGSILIDVGANFGYYSLSLAAYLNRDCRVFAAEPHPVTRARLERNIALNSMENVISVIPFGLSDCPGTAYLTGCLPENTGSTYVSADSSKGTPVRLITLDDMISTNELTKLDFLKIDVEGYEERLLRGGERTLRELRPTLLIEIMPSNLERAGSSAQKIADLLYSHGYSLFTVEREKLAPLTKVPSGTELVNVFCIRQ
jgi:FkbM family methyltransferase